jgi:hypothetical protein
MQSYRQQPLGPTFKINSDPDSVTFQITESVYKTLPGIAKAGRLKFPSALFAYPFYLVSIL